MRRIECNQKSGQRIVCHSETVVKTVVPEETYIRNIYMYTHIHIHRYIIYTYIHTYTSIDIYSCTCTCTYEAVAKKVKPEERNNRGVWSQLTQATERCGLNKCGVCSVVQEIPHQLLVWRLFPPPIVITRVLSEFLICVKYSLTVPPNFSTAVLHFPAHFRSAQHVLRRPNFFWCKAGEGQRWPPMAKIQM